MKKYSILCLLLLSLGLNPALLGQEKALPATESDFYKMFTLPIPEGMILEVGGLTTLPNGDLAAGTRRGEVYLIENPYMDLQTQPHYRLYAEGLHEILGLSYRDGGLYLAQRGELTRLSDRNGDGMADQFESVYAWPLSGHYHEYSYGPAMDEDGNMFVSGNVAFGDVEWWRGESRVPWRGWILRITPEGEMEPWATGVRSPCGLGVFDGELFYADNQGDWLGSGGLVHVEKGDFTGHPAGLRWADHPASPVKVRLEDIYSRVDPKMAAPGQKPIKPEDGPNEPTIPLYEVAEEVEGLKLPAVWLPHSVLGISTSQIVRDESGGAFGPFGGQLFIGDEGQSKIVRVFLEEINGTYQGAAFAFRDGFQSGVLRMTWGRDGSMFVGQTNRGWGSTGPKPFGLQRLVWTGKMPFEMKAVRAMPDGFEIEFTQPVDKRTASNPDSYGISSFTYKYHPVYGSPVVRDTLCPVEGVVVSKDGLKARLVISNLRKKYIHEIKALGVKAYYDQSSLLHPTAYYTLNEIPEGAKLNLPKRVAKPMHHSHNTVKASPAQQASAAPKKASPKKATTRPSRPRLAKRQTSMPKAWKTVDQRLVLGTRPGLKFDKTSITVKAGSKVRLSFNNNDDMPHNFVLVQPGQADTVGELAINLGVKGFNVGYIPQSSKVLVHTKLMNPGSKEDVYFYAPSRPGDYPFVCTVPGHHQLMRGVLRVVK